MKHNLELVRSVTPYTIAGTEGRAPAERSEAARRDVEVMVAVAHAAPGRAPAPAGAVRFGAVRGVSGRVHALGPGVTGLAVGQPVATLAEASAELSPGTLLRVPASRVVHLDTPYGAISLEEGAAAIADGPVAILALMDLGRVRPGDAAVVHDAASALGRLCASLGRFLGARPLIGVVDSVAERAQAASYGYTHVLTASEDLPSQVLALTAGRGAQVIVDPVGGPWRQASLAALRPLGRLVVVGQGSQEPEGQQISARDLWLGNHAVLGLNVGALAGAEPRRFQRAARAVLTLVARGAVSVDAYGVLPPPPAAGQERGDAGDGRPPARCA